MSKLRISTGTDNFKKMVTESDVFVDKSLFIKELIDNGKDAILITRPRRWGKSLALDMLKTFFAIEVDENGKKKEQNSNRVVFDKLKIKGHSTLQTNVTTLEKKQVDIIEGLQGAYPVIFINFKDVKAFTYETTKDLLIDSISRSFQAHHYLRVSRLLTQFQKDKLERYYEAFLQKDLLDEKDLKDSLRFLSEILAYS